MIKVGDSVRSCVWPNKDRVGIVAEIGDVTIKVFFGREYAPPFPDPFWLYCEDELKVVDPHELIYEGKDRTRSVCRCIGLLSRKFGRIESYTQNT